MHYRHHVVWIGSLRATSPVTLSGDMTAKRTEEEFDPVEIPASYFENAPRMNHAENWKQALALLEMSIWTSSRGSPNFDANNTQHMLML